MQFARSVAGEFEQTRQLSGVPFAITSSGEFEFNETDGLRWTTLVPIESQMIISKAGIWTSAAEKIDQTEFVGEIMLALFSGSLTELGRYFKLEYSCKEIGWQFNLSPKGGVLTTVFEHIELHGNQYIEQILLLDANFNKTVIQFTQQRSSKE